MMLSTILFTAYAYVLLGFFSYYKLCFIGQVEKAVSAFMPQCKNLGLLSTHMQLVCNIQLVGADLSLRCSLL